MQWEALSVWFLCSCILKTCYNSLLGTYKFCFPRPCAHCYQWEFASYYKGSYGNFLRPIWVFLNWVQGTWFMEVHVLRNLSCTVLCRDQLQEIRFAGNYREFEWRAAESGFVGFPKTLTWNSIQLLVCRSQLQVSIVFELHSSAKCNSPVPFLLLAHLVFFTPDNPFQHLKSLPHFNAHLFNFMLLYRCPSPTSIIYNQGWKTHRADLCIDQAKWSRWVLFSLSSFLEYD